MTDTVSEADIKAQLARLGDLRTAIAQAIVGQEDVVEQLLVALFAGGHVLLEGPPGTAKTLLAQCFARSVALDYGRIQFTPDLMPGDVIGANLFNFQTSTFSLTRGPVFCELLLADEINRTPPKTQAALLEAMQERHVTIDGTSHPLSPRFTVVATQNPIEQQGTYPLPEAQLDRFLLHIRVEYPSEQEERDILAQTTGSKTGAVPAVMMGEEVLALQKMVREVHFSEALLSWVTKIVRASRPGEGSPEEVRKYVKWGAGPRAGQSLILAAKARALLQGRLAATREDIIALAAPVMRHRLLLSFAAEAEGRSADDVVAALVRAVPMPTA
jgi:MoxR-like ATPase